MNQLNQNPSQRSIYIWNITGSIANALLSIVALMIVTRFLDDRQADIFSIAWSISLLMATVGTFQIRMYQATDVKGVFCFRQYHLFRIITVCVMMVSSYIYILMRGYTGKKALVVMVICLFRAVDSMADVYEGWFQQKERLDLAGSIDISYYRCSDRIWHRISSNKRSFVFMSDPCSKLYDMLCTL